MTDELREVSPEYHVPRKFRFTPENAREMQARGIKTRRLRASEKTITTTDTTVNAKAKPKTDDVFTSRTLERVKKQLEAIQKQMDDCTDETAWDKLSRSFERIFKVYAHLAALPGPGQHRPVTPKPARTRLAEPAQPTEIAPDPPA